MEKTYIGTYKVVKQYRISQRREVLARNLTLSEAQAMCGRYKDSSRHIICFYRQYYADKWFI